MYASCDISQLGFISIYCFFFFFFQAEDGIRDKLVTGVQTCALPIFSPEYNHGYSGLLKHALDTCLKEYIHKAVGVVGVSAGPYGGTRGIQDLLPVLRELGLVAIFWDVNFSAVHTVFDKAGALRDQAYLPRIDKFLKELVWMARTLRHGRESVALE